MPPEHRSPKLDHPTPEYDDLPDGDERRAAPRYRPDPLVAVLFAHPDADTPTAGLIADVSNGGVRIVAPPTARPHLHWGDPLSSSPTATRPASRASRA
ncbi:MAG: PilZ domain-containing protein [Myxococcota bacterium]